jgi:type IV secretion system protein VirB5
MLNKCRRLWLPMAALAAVPVAHAQFAVIDVAAVTQLLTQAQTLEQQLATAENTLSQAQAAYQSTTGQRGMQQLLANVPRNYLPSNWAGLQGSVSGSGSSPALNTQVQAALQAATVLTPQQLGTLSPAASQQLQAARQTVSLSQGVSRVALTNASGRFGELQQLIDSIAAAPDQKSILELQARILAEGSMLQDEQTKLQTLSQTLQAQHASELQRARELALAAHGNFAARFQPQP